jgi:hypothetical protein
LLLLLLLQQLLRRMQLLRLPLLLRQASMLLLLWRASMRQVVGQGEPVLHHQVLWTVATETEALVVGWGVVHIPSESVAEKPVAGFSQVNTPAFAASMWPKWVHGKWVEQNR